MTQLTGQGVGLRPVWANQRIPLYLGDSDWLRFRHMPQAESIKAIFWELTGARAEVGFKGQRFFELIF